MLLWGCQGWKCDLDHYKTIQTLKDIMEDMVVKQDKHGADSFTIPLHGDLNCDEVQLFSGTEDSTVKNS